MVKFKNILILLQLGISAMQMMMANSSERSLTFRTDTATAVYNLEVVGNHNYYVSASKVLVHNLKNSSHPFLLINTKKVKKFSEKQ